MSLVKNERRLDHSLESLHHKAVDAIKHDTVRWFHFYSLFSFIASISIATHTVFFPSICLLRGTHAVIPAKHDLAFLTAATAVVVERLTND